MRLSVQRVSPHQTFVIGIAEITPSFNHFVFKLGKPTKDRAEISFASGTTARKHDFILLRALNVSVIRQTGESSRSKLISSSAI
jgi:hypothetical protein